MRVLHIITSLNFGGAEKLLLDTCIEQQKLNNYVKVLYLKTEGKMLPLFGEQNIDVKKISIKGPMAVFVLLRLIYEIILFRPDVIHTHLTHADLLGRLAGLLTGCKKIVTTIHNTDPWRKSTSIGLQLVNQYDRLIVNQFANTVCIAISEAVRNHVIRYSNYNPRKVKLLKNAINEKKVYEASRMPTSYDKKQAFFLVNVGRLSQQKGQIVLLRAVNRLITEKRMRDFLCLIVGEGEERQALETYVIENNLSQYVHLLGVQQNPYKYMRLADIIVMPSLWEGFGIVVLEGYALKKPVIAANVDGLQEIVMENVTGSFFEPGNDKQLADLLYQVINTKANFYDKEAIMQVAQQYSIENYVVKLNEIYMN